MKSKLIILLLILSGGVTAQTKLYRSLQDYMNGKYETCRTLVFHERHKTRFLFGGASYDLYLEEENKYLEKTIQKKTRIIEIDTLTLINCRKLYLNNRRIGSGYTEAVRVKNRIFLKSYSVSDEASIMTGIAVGGIIGGVLAASVDKSGYYIYMLSNDKGDLKPVQRPLIMVLLDDHKALKKKYEIEKDPNNSKVIWKYLQLMSKEEKAEL